MAGNAVRKKVITPVPALAIDNPFKKYKKEQPQDVRNADLKKSPVQKFRLLLVLSSTQDPLVWHSCGADHQDYYANVIDCIKNMQYSASDIEKFSSSLGDFQGEPWFSEKAGFFLSALINNGTDVEYPIDTRRLNIPINYLGYKNTKNIIVDGNAGDACGMSMTSGKITIEGNAGFSLGLMSGGEIVVKGNALDCSGYEDYSDAYHPSMSDPDEVENVDTYCMSGGKVTIHGNCGDAGDELQGGEIHIEGEIGSIGNVKHGKIYHKGKLIADN